REGPLTDNELTAVNEGAIRAYEKSLITIAELAMTLCISHTGRRPIQISLLRVVDVLCGKNGKGEPFYVLNVPRAKQRSSTFRTNFKPFAISLELWAILNAQARNAIALVEKRLGFELQEDDRQQIPLFPDLNVLAAVQSPYEFRQLLATDKLHIPAAEITYTLQYIVEKSDIRSERTGELLHINARRFRYTTGTRAAREGFGELVIAELLDHTDTQNAGVYIKNIPEHVKKLDEAVGFQLAPYAQAFVGVLVDSERDAHRGNDPTSRIRTEMGQGVGTCGEHGFCGANIPIPCYTCMHFQPWLDGPHEEVYEGLLNERERVKEITGDIQIAAVLDRSIIAVADVIIRCVKRREELSPQGEITNG
ncbi:TPA: recombinase, partial [Escherichia coli]|nr:recombinase [Escherichia coli]